MNKDFIALIFMSILTVVALGYGLTTIPNPGKQRELKLDHKRVSDLGEIQRSIDTYYVDNNKLPDTLDELTPKNSYDTLSKIDPETGNPYEFLTESQTSYKLCATFTTDSVKEDLYSYDESNYSYSSFKDKFKHSIGHTCFDFTIQYTRYQESPSPTNKIINNIIDLSNGSESANQSN